MRNSNRPDNPQRSDGEPGHRAPVIKIDKGIPLPPPRAAQMRYPWLEMEPGDSFFVPGKKASQISSPLRAAQIATGRRYTSQTVDGGVRVWRLPE